MDSYPLAAIFSSAVGNRILIDVGNVSIRDYVMLSSTCREAPRHFAEDAARLAALLGARPSPSSINKRWSSVLSHG
jgi:hypothetical protein